MVIGSFTTANSSYAVDKAPKGYSDVINNFIDGYMTGDHKKLDKVFSDDASIKIPRADAVLVHSREKMLEQMKNAGTTNQNCRSNYEVLDKSDAMIIAKVNFKYNEFTQHNYIVLEKNENKEWKITQVCKFFEDNSTSKQAPTNVTASNL